MFTASPSLHRFHGLSFTVVDNYFHALKKRYYVKTHSISVDIKSFGSPKHMLWKAMVLEGAWLDRRSKLLIPKPGFHTRLSFNKTVQYIRMRAYDSAKRFIFASSQRATPCCEGSACVLEKSCPRFNQRTIYRRIAQSSVHQTILQWDRSERQIQ